MNKRIAGAGRTQVARVGKFETLAKHYVCSLVSNMCVRATTHIVLEHISERRNRREKREERKRKKKKFEIRIPIPVSSVFRKNRLPRKKKKTNENGVILGSTPATCNGSDRIQHRSALILVNPLVPSTCSGISSVPGCDRLRFFLQSLALERLRRVQLRAFVRRPCGSALRRSYRDR